MHSIRTRITLLTLAAILCCILLIGGTVIIAIQEESDDDTSREMILLCADRRHTLNQYLESIKQSADMVSRFASESMSGEALAKGGVAGFTGDGSALDGRDWDTDRQRDLDAYLREYCAVVDEVLLSLANHTNGLAAYYYRINPEISRSEEGVFFVKGDTDAFEAVPMTDVFAIDRDDYSRVGWYFETLRRGRPSWLEPYYNANLQRNVVSYVTPIYKGDTFIGIIGMDIPFETLIEQVSDLTAFETGFAYLTDSEGQVLYHPEIAAGKSIEAISPELAEAAEHMRHQDSSAETTLYRFGGETKKLAFTTLTNGMKLVLVAPVSEINAGWIRLIKRIMLTGLLILVVFAILTAFAMKRITDPLQRLTEASKHLAAGNYDVELEYHRNDEVGILTDSFRHLVEHLRIYISDLNSKAYRDSLTGVRNKGAYDIFTRKLNDAIRTEQGDKRPEFGVMMFDCNELKEINDAHGHEKGDHYLTVACKLVCTVFSHSPVFRVGGDEFIAVLQGDDYTNRYALLERFDQMAAEINAREIAVWNRVSLAKGLAEYDPRRDARVEDVLRRADEAMYADKDACKAGG